VENRKVKQSCWGLVPGEEEGYKERVKEGEGNGNITYSCMKMEKKTY
jgi:hypothetical protein